ncbi:glycosyl transferase [Marinobacterium nitratireducens]|uniref:Glycosyl transferase n=1 Tax=Marinobacterium nitratireducens TaxID=518897 RepID=A0A917ZRL3_9GAMM|nr:MJ1255/VC2487 family glycosyltransferase [Marinobacterium nitratireducens]GGO88786.1 glycosyl transferase [Marinobacterium nitratireducens]
MKILYGVQATGNGHITRARVMAPALAEAGLEVDYLFSGREPQGLFDMEPFGDYACRRGLTFRYRPGGRIDVPGTLFGNSLRELFRDIRKLDLGGYDLVISDFEPVTAWAARRRGVPSLGIAHQYVFNHRLPGGHQSRGTRAAIRSIAPVDTAIGLHWHHFGQPILPPLISPPRYPVTLEADKILVYLPYEPRDELLRWFRPFDDHRFVVYSAVDRPQTDGNVHFRPFCRDGFERDLASCAGVISNSGFGLASETVQYGKKLLSKPYLGQVEQLSNADIMAELGMATVMQQQFDPGQLAGWLRQSNPEPGPYPDVAGALARWIAGGQREAVSELARQLWSRYEVQTIAGDRLALERAT